MKQKAARWNGRLAVAALASLVLVACGSQSTASATPKSYSGTLLFASFNPFTGPDASFGPEMSAGCIVAASLINKAGGVLGHTVQCIDVDSRGDPADAVPAAEKMIATNPNLVGMNGPSSDEALATVPIIDRAHLPMFGDTGQAQFDHNSYAYFYRLTPADDAQGIAMAIYAYRKGYRRGAAVFNSDIGSQGNVPNLVNTFKKLGGQIVVNQQLAAGEPSYRSEVESAIQSNPDVIFTESSPQTAAAYLSQLKQLHGVLPVVGTQPTVQPPWGAAVSGAIGASTLAQIFAAVQPYSPSSGPAYDIENTELLALGSKIPQPGPGGPGQWSGDPYTETDYDAINIMALAMIMAGTPDPSFYNKYIRQVVADTPGATEVHSYQEGRDALKAGKKIRYVGAGGPIALDKYNNSNGAFQVVGYSTDPNNPNPQIDVVSAADISKYKS